jgi:drug/metabolite transporter (DMT)-like permease
VKILNRHFELFVLAATLFGGTFVAVRAGLEYFPPLLFVALRFDLAALVLLPYVLLTQNIWRPQTRHDVIGVFVTGVVALGGSNALLFIGQQSTTSAVAAIIYSFAPILTPVFALLLLSDERLSARGVVGLFVGLLGVGVVVAPTPTTLLSNQNTGQVILLCGAINVALGSVLIQRVDAPLPSVTETAWGLPFGAAVLHLTSVVTGESITTVEWTPTAILTLVYVGVFAGAVAYTAYFTLLSETGAIQTNLINYAIPIVATFFGWLLLGEPITLTTYAGFLIIFTGFGLIKYQAIRTILFPSR